MNSCLERITYYKATNDNNNWVEQNWGGCSSRSRKQVHIWLLYIRSEPNWQSNKSGSPFHLLPAKQKQRTPFTRSAIHSVMRCGSVPFHCWSFNHFFENYKLQLNFWWGVCYQFRSAGNLYKIENHHSKLSALERNVDCHRIISNSNPKWSECMRRSH